LTVSPRCSPLFTVMLVHGWYMKPLHCWTTLRGGRFGAIGERDAPRHGSMLPKYRWGECGSMGRPSSPSMMTSVAFGSSGADVSTKPPVVRLVTGSGRAALSNRVL
jgi:hypothetical protein